MELATTDVVIPVEDYNRLITEHNRLLQRERKLDALEAGGVDNWEWYDQSMENASMYDEEEPMEGEENAEETQESGCLDPDEARNDEFDAELNAQYDEEVTDGR